MLDLSVFFYVSSEIIIAISVLLLVLLGSFLNQKINKRVYPAFSIIVLSVCAFLLWKDFNVTEVIIFNQLFSSSGYVSFSKILVILSSIASVLISMGYSGSDKRLLKFEYYTMLLLSVLGMLVMISSNDLMSLYLGLELMSLSLYALVSFSRKSIISSEAGLKYFILGALASCVLLYGSSLIYGFTGTTNFSLIEAMYHKYSSGTPMPIGVLVGFILIISSICFKIAAAPFHMWAPDVYQGSPLPVTAFLSTAPKAASILLLIKLLISNFNIWSDAWRQIISVIACLSLIIGALGALFQSDIKRLIAYSSISHIGFLLVGLISYNKYGVEASLIYLCIYITMNLGLFSCVAIIQNQNSENFDLSIFKGLSKTNPIISLCIAVLIFSMAGIPPFAGFLAKFYIIYGAIRDGLYFISIFAMLTAIVSTFYYLKIIKFMYFDETEIHVPNRLFSVENVIIASFATTFNVILILFPMSFHNILHRSITSLF